MIITDQRVLSRLVHLACWRNIPISVGVDWSCQTDHDEPGCIRYDFRVPVSAPGDEPDGRLELLEELLTKELARLGLATQSRLE